MEKITHKLILGDSATFSYSGDLILTDPPYDMSGKTLANIINRYDCKHLVLITSLYQLIDFLKHTNYEFSFDFVLDAVVPKKSKNIHQPNYTHQNGIYLKKKGEKSLFNRKKRQRSDTFDNNGYWPTVLRAPRENMHEHGMAKNSNTITDILGSFEVKSVIDPFAGTGITTIAASEINISSISIEKDLETYKIAKKNLRFLGV